jgi:phosphotriesterase-related protein
MAAGIGSIDWHRSGVALAQTGPTWLTAKARTAPSFPRGAVIRTILKDLPPDALNTGATMFHEHLSGYYSSPPVERGAAGQPRGEMDDLDLMVDEMRASRHDGVHCIVDSALRRRSAENVEEMRRLSSRSGMHIVLGGGYYKAPYPAEVSQMSEDQLADQFCKDAAEQRWGAIGEIGTSLTTHPDERKGDAGGQQGSRPYGVADPHAHSTRELPEVRAGAA